MAEEIVSRVASIFFSIPREKAPKCPINTYNDIGFRVPKPGTIPESECGLAVSCQPASWVQELVFEEPDPGVTHVGALQLLV